MSQFSGITPSVEKFCEDSDGTRQGTYLHVPWMVVPKTGSVCC